MLALNASSIAGADIEHSHRAREYIAAREVARGERDIKRDGLVDSVVHQDHGTEEVRNAYDVDQGRDLEHHHDVGDDRGYHRPQCLRDDDETQNVDPAETTSEPCLNENFRHRFQTTADDLRQIRRRHE